MGKKDFPEYCSNCDLWISHDLWKESGKKCPRCSGRTLTVCQWNQMIEEEERIRIEKFLKKGGEWHGKVS